MKQVVIRSRGFSLIELMVVLGIVMVLVGLLFPVIRRVRGHAERTKCASNLRQIGIAFHGYASEYRGAVPRYAADYFSQDPLWLGVIPVNLGAKRDFQWGDLPALPVLQCPSHPTSNIPCAYVLNTFAFETAPAWTGSPPIQISKAKQPAKLVWLLEAADHFGPSRYGFDAIFFEPYHIVRSPQQIDQRIAPARHVGGVSNVLYLDGHVVAERTAQISLAAFDDGIRQR